MAIQSQPSRIPEPFAASGTKNVLPATNAAPSASQAASWASGFPPECSQPLSAGGCPVPRNDVNGALNQISQDFAFRQDGGVWAWSALADYDVQRVVRGSDGLLYYSTAQSGPGAAAGAQDPAADASHAYWGPLKTATMPVTDSSDAAATTAWVQAWDADKQMANRIYVNGSTGSDSSDGLTPATAKKTIAGAAAYYEAADRAKYRSVGIYISAGTYSEPLLTVDGLSIYYYSVDGTVTCQGATVDRMESIAIGGSFTFTGKLSVSRTGIIQLGTSTVSTALAFSGISDEAALEAYSGGNFYLYNSGQPVSIDFSSCTFSVATLFVGYGSSFVNYGTLSWSGAATGKTYSAVGCSVIRGVGTPTPIPGTASGTVDSTSFYS